MNCEQMQKLMHAYHDRELDAANMLQVDEHIARCPQCTAALREIAALGRMLRHEELRFAATDRLRRAILGQVTQAGAAEQEAAPVRSRGAWFGYAGWAAAVVVLLFAVVASGHRSLREDDRLVAELTASHIRSLMATHLTDVASTDQHTVKPWFDGKLPFAPPVRDFREQGFPLLGGRLDFIAGRPAAALVYGREKHYVNLFIWPATNAERQPVHTAQREGYNVVRWADGAMEYSAVSDLNAPQLRSFAAAWAGVQ